MTMTEDTQRRLAAFGRDCVNHGDMTPAGARMLSEILEQEVEKPKISREEWLKLTPEERLVRAIFAHESIPED